MIDMRRTDHPSSFFVFDAVFSDQMITINYINVI